ncbi:MAG: hypothetical protein J1F37_04245 [Oscillospiraceae bacterium]|nr:hypothetical protein [Oscillospiraceae bacterium]
MNKKIIAAFCIVILMVSIFSACGNKGYLLAKDENGVEHAYVTDENGETVLNEEGNIRVYETDAHGKIVKDKDGTLRENYVEMPEKLMTDKKYQTKEFVFIIPNGWGMGDANYISISQDGLSRIQFNNIGTKISQYNSIVAEEVDMANKIVDEIKNSGGTAELKEGTATITSNQIEAYYMLFDAEIESDGVKQVLHTCAAYFMFEGRIYKAFYQTTSEEGLKIEQVVDVFNNLTLNHIESENETIIVTE